VKKHVYIHVKHLYNVVGNPAQKSLKRPPTAGSQFKVGLMSQVGNNKF